MTGQPADDSSVPDESLLFRRIPVQRAFVIWDDNRGDWRISSQAFRNHRENPLALSVHLEVVLNELGLQPESVLADASKYGLVGIQAGAARQLGQTIQRLPEPDDPAHAHLVGEKPKPVQRALAELATWVIRPAVT